MPAPKGKKSTHDSEILGGPFKVKTLKISDEDYCYNNTILALGVAKSQIPGAGRGLFSKERIIEKGTLIGYYDGEVLDNEKLISDYSFQLDETWFIDGLNFPRCYIAMVNDPHGTKFIENCSFEIQMYDDSGKKLHPKDRKIFLIATRTIVKGEELFASYGSEYWECESRKNYCKSKK